MSAGRRVESAEQLKGRVRGWAARLRVAPREIRVQRMTRKWGSCSHAGRVTLASDLLAESRSFQDFVIVHELLHLRVRNHGRLFRTYLSAFLPSWKRHVTRSLKAEKPPYGAGRRLTARVARPQY